MAEMPLWIIISLLTKHTYPSLQEVAVGRSRYLEGCFGILTELGGVNGQIGDEIAMSPARSVFRLSRGNLQCAGHRVQVHRVQDRAVIEQVFFRDFQAVARAFAILPRQITNPLPLSIGYLRLQRRQDSAHDVLVCDVDFSQ